MSITTTPINEIPAGRELDKLVAINVAGWIRHDDSHGFPRLDISRAVKYPHYSTNIESAWKIVDRLETLHLEHAGEKGMWKASFCSFPAEEGHGETAELAICRAALLAMEVYKGKLE